MLEFMNQIVSHINKDLRQSYEKMNVIAKNGINHRDLTFLEEVKFINMINKRFSNKIGHFPTISDLRLLEGREIISFFKNLEIYSDNGYPLLNQHIEYIQEIHTFAYSEKSISCFIQFLQKNQIAHIDEFTSEVISAKKNISFIKFYILATLFAHIDAIINEQCKKFQPICLNELFRYRLNPLTSEIKDNKVIFHNQKSKFLLPSRQFLKFLSLWQNFDPHKQQFPLKARGITFKEFHKNSPYKSYLSELIKDINDTSELIPIYFEDINKLLTGFDHQNINYDKFASQLTDSFNFHLLSVWLIYIFQNYMGQVYKFNNTIPVFTFWLDLWESFLPHYDLKVKADHLIKWPADFYHLTNPID